MVDISDRDRDVHGRAFLPFFLSGSGISAFFVSTGTIINGSRPSCCRWLHCGFCNGVRVM